MWGVQMVQWAAEMSARVRLEADEALQLNVQDARAWCLGRSGLAPKRYFLMPHAVSSATLHSLRSQQRPCLQTQQSYR